MAVGNQSRPQCLEVVDLAVERDADGTVFVRHRLIAERRQVDDRETTEAEADAVVVADEDSLRVGSAMVETIAHRHDVLGADWRTVERQFTADAAHDYWAARR